MVSRKRRIPVVIDTNVFVRAFLARTATNPNQQVVRLWLLEKRLQLIVSKGLIEEYLGIFGEVLGMDNDLIAAWQTRFTSDSRTTFVNLGRRYTESRDPDDNLILATAAAGRVGHIVTNDRDLLDLAPTFKRSLTYDIQTPKSFVEAIAAR